MFIDVCKFFLSYCGNYSVCCMVLLVGVAILEYIKDEEALEDMENGTFRLDSPITNSTHIMGVVYGLLISYLGYNASTSLITWLFFNIPIVIGVIMIISCGIAKIKSFI